MHTENTEQLNKSFLEEYNSQDSIRKYSTLTAGQGVNYLLQHDYAKVYLDAVESCLETSRAPLRLLEFGCGAGMNLNQLLTLLDTRKVPVEAAYGTDFSVTLIESAKREAQAYLAPQQKSKVSFCVARNEKLAEDLAASSGRPLETLLGSFDLVLGVNTFRYCHRLAKAQECAADIYHLLRPGGICIVIDMNDRFPLFRSRLNGAVESAEECYLPSLEEYASPFEKTGFEVTTRENFCWIPHSAGPVMTFAGRVLTPFLNAVARSRAMRSLVVARKPL